MRREAKQSYLNSASTKDFVKVYYICVPGCVARGHKFLCTHSADEINFSGPKRFGTYEKYARSREKCSSCEYVYYF